MISEKLSAPLAVKTLSYIVLLPLMALMFIGCMSSGPASGPDIDNAPSWYLDVPDSSDRLYASASAQSRRMQMAIDRAETDARQSIAAEMEAEIRSMTRIFEEELEDELREQFLQVTQEIVSQTLRGSSASEREVTRQNDGMYRAYVLMQMPIGEAAQEFLASLENRDEAMYTRLRASEAFEEMHGEIDRYEGDR